MIRLREGYENPAGDENRGWFALVCYVPDPLKTEVERLCESIPGRGATPLHITVLPPRPLAFELSVACALVEALTREFAPFEAEFSELRRFEGTDFLYLDIDAGATRIREMHARLNGGPLNGAELYEFRPHLTLAGPVPRAMIGEVEQRAAKQWREVKQARRIRLHEVVCLWLPPGKTEPEWERVATFSLSGENARGTAAGRESSGQESKILS